MATEYRLKVEIADACPPENAAGLLIPLPPTTPHQRLQGVGLDSELSVLPVTAQSGAQSALFVTLERSGWKKPIQFVMEDCGVLERTHFIDATVDKCRLDADAMALAGEIDLAGCECAGERLEAIVGALADKFQYKSGHTNEAPLTCDILTGNCMSINDAFLKMAKVAAIPSAYYIGYCFQGPQTLDTRDWHCWVGTLTERGCENWDIAHHLKRNIQPVRPGLNPLPGVRFATSVGRDLSFILPVGEVTVPHLCEPRWIFRDGTSRRCEVRVSLETANQSGLHMEIQEESPGAEHGQGDATQLFSWSTI